LSDFYFLLIQKGHACSFARLPGRIVFLLNIVFYINALFEIYTLIQ